MKYGWTEMKTWGDEAQDLIDAFDGLVGVYRGMPDVNPEWEDLAGRHEKAKQAMAEMVRTKITNDKDVRLKKLEEVKALVKEVRNLSTEIRTRAQEASTPKPQTSTKPQGVPSTQSAEKSAEKTQPEELSKPSTKPAITVDDLKRFVSSTPSLGLKDTPDKYRGRADRALKQAYSNVTDSHLEAVEKLAKARYFASSEDSGSKPSTTPAKGVDAPVDWTERVLDVNGAKADLSDFDSTMKTKILDIAQTDGRGHHGGTVLSGSHGSCLHWRLGDMRIFGNVDSGTFTLIGTGRHSGKGNANYKVDLLLGGTANAQTG